MLFPDVQHAKAVANLIWNARQVCAAALRLPIMVVAAVATRVRGGVFQRFSVVLIPTRNIVSRRLPYLLTEAYISCRPKWIFGCYRSLIISPLILAVSSLPR